MPLTGTGVRDRDIEREGNIFILLELVVDDLGIQIAGIQIAGILVCYCRVGNGFLFGFLSLNFLALVC